MDQPTHFSVYLPLTEEQANEAKALLGTYQEWATAKVYQTAFDTEVSAEDLAFFERVFNPDFEDNTGFEIVIKRGHVIFQDEAGAPNVQGAGDFLSAIMDRYNIDGTLDLVWTAAHSGVGVVSRSSIDWGDEVQITKQDAPTP